MAEEAIPSGAEDLPIEEIGVDLVVNADENFVSAMSKAGRQFTTFATQSTRLAGALPALNDALASISATLRTINDKTTKTEKVIEALSALSKMPARMTAIGEGARGAGAAVKALMADIGAANEAYREGMRLKREFTGVAGARAEGARMKAKEGVSKETAAAAGDKPVSRKRASEERRSFQPQQAHLDAVEKSLNDTNLAVDVYKEGRRGGSLSAQTAERLRASIAPLAESADIEKIRRGAAKIAAMTADEFAGAFAKASPESAIGDNVSLVITTIKKAISGTEDIGEWFGPSLAEGIKKSASDAVAAAEKLGKDTLEGVADGTGIHSLSDPLIDMGTYAGPSVAVGVEKGTPAAVDAAEKLGKATVEAVGSSIAAGSGSVLDEIHKLIFKLREEAEAAGALPPPATAAKEALERSRKRAKDSDRKRQQEDEGAARETGAPNPYVSRTAPVPPPKEAAPQQHTIASAAASIRADADAIRNNPSVMYPDEMFAGWSFAKGISKEQQRILTDLRSWDSNRWAQVVKGMMSPAQLAAAAGRRENEDALRGTVFNYRTEAIRAANQRQLDMAFGLAGVSGMVPGTNIGGSAKVRRSLDSSGEGGQGPLGANLVVRSVHKRGGNATFGTGIAWRDFNGLDYQRRMSEMNARFKGERDFGQLQPGTPEWEAVLKNYSSLQRRLPWQGTPVSVPGKYKEQQEEFLAGVDASIQKILVEKLKYYKDDLPAMARRLSKPEGLKGFAELFEQDESLAQYAKFGVKEIAKYIRQKGYSQKAEEDFAAKHGDPQIKAETTELYAEARKAISRADSIEEAIGLLNDVETKVQKLFQDKFAAGEGAIWGELAKRPDPVVQELIANTRRWAAIVDDPETGLTRGQRFDEGRRNQRLLEDATPGGYKAANDLYAAYVDAQNIIEHPRVTNQQLALRHQQEQRERERAAFLKSPGKQERYDRLVKDVREEAKKLTQPLAEQQIDEAVLRAISFGGMSGSFDADRDALLRGNALGTWRRRTAGEARDSADMRRDYDQRDISGSQFSIRPKDATRMAAQISDRGDVQAALERLRVESRAITDSLIEQREGLDSLIDKYAKEVGKTRDEVASLVERARSGKDKRVGKSRQTIVDLQRSIDETARQAEDINTQIYGLSNLSRGPRRVIPDPADTAGRKPWHKNNQDEILGQAGEAITGGLGILLPQRRGPEELARRRDMQKRARANRMREVAAARERLVGADDVFNEDPAANKEAHIRASTLKQTQLGEQLKQLTSDYSTMISFASATFEKDWQTAWDSIAEPSRVFFARAAANVKALVNKGVLSEDAGAEFEAGLDSALKQIADLGGRIGRGQGKKLTRAQMIDPFEGLAESAKNLGGLSALIEDQEKIAAESAVAEAAEQQRQQQQARDAARGAGWRRYAEMRSPQAAAWQAANAARSGVAAQAGAQTASQAAAKAAPPSFVFPDDWVVRIINAIHAGADKVVAAVAKIQAIAMPGAGGAQTAAGSSKGRSGGGDIAGLKEDLARTSEVDAYRASHTAMRQVRMANELNPDEIVRLQAAIDAWRAGAIKAAADAIAAEGTRGEVVDAFRATRSQSDLDLQRLVGPEIRKTIEGLERATGDEMMRLLVGSFGKISTVERGAATALQKSGAPLQVIQEGLAEIEAEAERARVQVIEFAQSAESYRILNAQVDTTVDLFRELGEQTKFNARQQDQRPAARQAAQAQREAERAASEADAGARRRARAQTQATDELLSKRQLLLNVERNIGKALEGARAKVDPSSLSATDKAAALAGIDAAARAARQDIDGMLAELDLGGDAASASMVELKGRIQSVAFAAKDAADAAKTMVASAGSAKKSVAGPGVEGFDTKRARNAIERRLNDAFGQASALRTNDLIDQAELDRVYDKIVDLRVKIADGITRAIKDTRGLTVTEQGGAVRLAIEQYSGELTAAVGEMRRMEKVAASVEGRLRKVSHAARDAAVRMADVGAAGRKAVAAQMEDSVAYNFAGARRKADTRIGATLAGVESQLADMYARARAAAAAGDKAAVDQLAWEIRKLSDTAESAVDATVEKILARTKQVEAQTKRIADTRKYAGDPASYLQDRLEARATQGGIGGWLARRRLGAQEQDAAGEMFLAVQRERAKAADPAKMLKPFIDAMQGVGYTFKWLFNLAAAPVAIPAFTAMYLFKRSASGIVAAASKVGGALAALTGKGSSKGQDVIWGLRNRKDLRADDRGQMYGQMYEEYKRLFETVNRRRYSPSNAGKSFFSAPSYDSKSLDRQARDLGRLQNAYEKLQRTAVKQGLIDAPISAVGRAARTAMQPVNMLVSVVTLGMVQIGKETEKAAGTVDRLGNELGQAGAQRGMKKIFADMGTGVGLGFGMSFSMGIINAIQGIGWRIQSTITGIVSRGFGAVVETEMRKLAMRSLTALSMMETPGAGGGDFGAMWDEAGAKAENYYKTITDIAKFSSFSRTPLLDAFQKFQVAGLSGENAQAAVTAATMFGDAFQPGNKQMLDTFGTQASQMLQYGVAQTQDIKLMGEQGIPVFKFLAQNIERYAAMGVEEAKKKVAEDITKGEIGGVEAFEAIVEGMIAAAGNFKGKAATTFSGLMSTFGDLMLEKSEAIVGPVAESLFKPFIEAANDFLQWDAVTAALDAFGKKIAEVSLIIQNTVAQSLGVFLGLWNALPSPVREAIKAFALATTIIAGLTAAMAAAAALGALLAPVLSIVSGGMVAAAAALGTAITAYTTNFMGFRDWLNSFAAGLAASVAAIGQTIAWGLLEAVGTASQFGADIINGFMSDFVGNAEKIYAAVYAWGQGVATAIGAGIATVSAWVAQAIDWLWALPTNMDDILGAIGQWFNDLFAGFGQALAWLGEWVDGAVEAMWAIPENMGKIVDQMFDYGAGIVEVFAQGMQGAINVVFDALSAIGQMFTDWLEPHSPPRLLPDLDKWGTAAADIYLQGWTQADFGVLNDLSSKLEEALALDEGALEEGQTVAIRNAVAEMVGKAAGGVADISSIMGAMPGWGGRAEQVLRLSAAYANLAVTQHALTVEQEALDKITAQYDARLTPLQNKLKSITNKQEDLDLTKQIQEWQRVLDNVYASDEQKKAARLKMDELKLSEQINDIEMERDALTDPINDRIAAMTVENQEAQKALDLANERWAVEMGIMQAGQGQGGSAGGEDAADKADEEKAGAEKNRQFTQPKLDVPAFSGVKGLGSIAEKMKGVSDKIASYFEEMGKKAEPLTRAIASIGGGVDTMRQNIEAGMNSGAFTAEGGLAGFLNNVGVFAGTAIATIDTLKLRIDGLVQAWTNPLGTTPEVGDPGGPIGPKTAEQAGWMDFGGFEPIVTTTEMRMSAVVEDLQFNLDDAKLKITGFAGGVKKAFDDVDWAQIQLDLTTNLAGASTALRDWVAGIPGEIAAALGVDSAVLQSENPSDVVGEVDKTTDRVTNFTTQIAEAAGKIISSVVNVFAVELGKYVLTTEQAAMITTSSIILISEVIKNLNAGIEGFLRGAEFSEAASEAGKQIGRIMVGIVIGAIYGGVFLALDSDEIHSSQASAQEAVRDIVGEFLKGLIASIIDEVAQRFGVPPGVTADAVTGAVEGFTNNPNVQAVSGAMSEMTKPLGAVTGSVGFMRDIGKGWAKTPQGQAFGSWAVGQGDAAQASLDTGRLLPGQEAVDSALTDRMYRTHQLVNPASMAPANIDAARAQIEAENHPSMVLPTQRWTATDMSPYMPDATQQKQLGTGIAQGVTTEMQAEFGRNVPDAIQKFLLLWLTGMGIQSPSTVMRDRVGLPMGQGIVAGVSAALTGEGGAAPGAAPGGVGGIVGAAYTGILQATTLFGLNLNAAFLNLKSSITSTLGVLKTEWTGVFEATYTALQEQFDVFAVSWVEEKIPALKDAIIDLAVQAKDGVIQAMQDAVDGLNQKLQDMLSALTSDDIRADFYDAGHDLGENLADGIVEALTGDAADDKFESMADAVINEIMSQLKAAAGIKSPSKVMRNEVGAPLTQGIAAGMAMPRAMRLLETSSGNVIEQVVRQFRGVTPALRVSDNYLRQPEENLVARGGGSRTYVLNLSVTPQQAMQVERNYHILEVMA